MILTNRSRLSILKHNPKKEKQYVKFIETVNAELSALEAAGFNISATEREIFRRLHQRFQGIFEDQISPLSEEERLVFI